MTREDVLRLAAECVCGHREQDYGTPEDSFRTIANMWQSYLEARFPVPAAYDRIEITPKDVAAMMALLKIARIAGGNGTDDSWIDLAGYAACGGELQRAISVAAPQDEQTI